MKLLIIGVTVLWLGTATVSAQKVKVDVDSSANFATFKTFGWDKGMVARNPLISDLIVAAVEGELTKRGLTKSTDNPDVKVAVAAAAGTDLQAVGPTWNVNYAVWGGYTNPAAIMNVTTGTLILDLVETKREISVFRGVARETLNRSVSADPAADAKSVEKLIKKAVTKMFQKYPAANKK